MLGRVAAILWAALAFLAPLAAAQEGSDVGEGNGLGSVALAFFIAASVFIPYNWVRRRFLLRWMRGRREATASLQRLHNRALLPSHMVLGVVALGTGYWHGKTASASNSVLWTAIVVMAGLVVGGALLRWAWTPGSVRRAAYFLHAQWAMFFALVALLLVGHAMVED